MVALRHEQSSRRQIRGIPREQLDALPLDKWQAQKERFAYETWLEEARKRLAKQ
jgi:hypothetical protein